MNQRDDRPHRHERDPRRDSPRSTPSGAERAERARGVLPPSPRKQRRATPERPDLPRGLEPDLPRGVKKELGRHARSDKEATDLARALTAATLALDAGEADEAVTYLEWAKAVVPRAPSIRETLGVARYLAEDWSEAMTELQAYRRLTGRQDQNHLIADCSRALGRPSARIGELVQDMDADRDGLDRVVEGVIVWANALADDGDPGAGRAVLRRVLDRLPAADQPAEHDVRLWYAVADLADRDGDDAAAERWFTRVASVDEDLYDVRDRLARLRSSG